MFKHIFFYLSACLWAYATLDPVFAMEEEHLEEVNKNTSQNKRKLTDQGGTNDAKKRKILSHSIDPSSINFVGEFLLLPIFEEMSKLINPRQLTYVCKGWYQILRGLNDPTGQELHYADMTFFMKNCMNIYWESRFYNGVLRFVPPYDDEDGRRPVLDLKFSDLNEEGTFYLSTCKHEDYWTNELEENLVITTNMDRFFKIQGMNELQSVILITPRYVVEQRIKSQADHPFAPLMAGWDADKAPIGMFFKGFHWGGLSFNYLITESTKKLAAKSLFDLHQCEEVRHNGIGMSRAEWEGENMLQIDFNPKKELMPISWENQFNNGVLKYMLDDDGVIESKFSDLNEEGTFDSSDTGCFVVTTNMKRFFEENSGQTVILITPRYVVEQGIQSQNGHPFAPLMADWDGVKAPIGIFWRSSGNKDLTCIDYLTTESPEKFAEQDLLTLHFKGNRHKNWQENLPLESPEDVEEAFYVDFEGMVKLTLS